MKFSTLFHSAHEDTVFRVYRKRSNGIVAICSVDKVCKVPNAIYHSEVSSYIAVKNDEIMVILNEKAAEESER